MTSAPAGTKNAGRWISTVLTVVFSVLVWLLVGLGNPGFLRLRMLVFSLIVGSAILGACKLLHALLQARLGALPQGRQGLAWAVVYGLGGTLGYSLGVPLAGLLTRVSIGAPPRVVLVNLTVMAALATVVGLALHFYGRLEARLRQSVARLHQAEFAERELEFARAIQRRLQPPEEINGPGFRIAARSLPAAYVAGDFYDTFSLADGLHGVVVGDVSGKGMGAALIMASVKSRLSLLAAGRSVETTLAALNESLLEELAPRDFVALAYARFDPRSGALEIGNAGLPDPYLVSEDGTLMPLSVPGPRLPLGIWRGIAHQSLLLEVPPGGRVLFLTDGVAEAPTERREPLGYEELASLLEAQPRAPILPWLDGILAAVERQAPGDRADDWTLLVLERQ
ncbi:MAG: PP2C family protein-serine/threonine phosphatase [Acidobacteriota bacterium]